MHEPAVSSSAMGRVSRRGSQAAGQAATEWTYGLKPPQDTTTLSAFPAVRNLVTEPWPGGPLGIPPYLPRLWPLSDYGKVGSVAGAYLTITTTLNTGNSTIDPFRQYVVASSLHYVLVVAPLSTPCICATNDK